MTKQEKMQQYSAYEDIKTKLGIPHETPTILYGMGRQATIGDKTYSFGFNFYPDGKIALYDFATGTDIAILFKKSDLKFVKSFVEQIEKSLKEHKTQQEKIAKLQMQAFKKRERDDKNKKMFRKKMG